MRNFLLPALALAFLFGKKTRAADFSGTLPEPAVFSGQRDFYSLGASIIDFFLGLVGVVLFLVILYAGAQLLTANGDEEKIGSARKIITYGVGGAVLLALSYAIVRWLLLAEGTLGTGY